MKLQSRIIQLRPLQAIGWVYFQDWVGIMPIGLDRVLGSSPLEKSLLLSVKADYHFHAEHSLRCAKIIEPLDSFEPPPVPRRPSVAAP